jgi:hypothetical protein
MTALRCNIEPVSRSTVWSVCLAATRRLKRNWQRHGVAEQVGDVQYEDRPGILMDQTELRNRCRHRYCDCRCSLDGTRRVIREYEVL